MIWVRIPTPLTPSQEYAEFTYDDEYDWFKVICLEDDQFKINQAFGKLALEIEAEAFDVHEDDILYTNDTLIVSLDISAGKTTC